MDFFKMKKEIKFLIVLFILAFIIRSIFVFSTPLKIWDETVYANLGYDLSHNLLDYSVRNKGWSDFIPSGGDEFYAWPKMGFRAPLLPYLISIIYSLRLDFFINFLIPLIGALSVLLIYILSKELFNKETGIIAALILTFIPLHVFYSGKILTEVLSTFFIILTFISFWRGYEKEDKKNKVLFGFFLALSLLSRYTTLWIMPVFLIYFLIRNKSLKFLKDKYLWYAIGIFFLTLLPWLIYGIIEYHNPIGAFVHGFKASAYWGGVQPWYSFFEYWWMMFSIVGIIFLISLGYIIYKKEFLKKENYLLLIWFVFFLGVAIYMPHKEDRFLIPLIPPMIILTSFFLDKIKRYKKGILIGITIILLLSLSLHFYDTYKSSYTQNNKCFLQANEFLEKLDKNSLVITDESAIVYYYAKQETRFYPNPWNYEILKSIANNSSSYKRVYVLFGEFIQKPEEEYRQIEQDLRNKSEKVFECSNSSQVSLVE